MNNLEIWTQFRFPLPNKNFQHLSIRIWVTRWLTWWRRLGIFNNYPRTRQFAERRSHTPSLRSQSGPSELRPSTFTVMESVSKNAKHAETEWGNMSRERLREREREKHRERNRGRPKESPIKAITSDGFDWLRCRTSQRNIKSMSHNTKEWELEAVALIGWYLCP